jgi:prepilin-type processing-associated H-X9-DG protein
VVLVAATGWQRHMKVANYLYLDGHAATLPWQAAVIDMYPEQGVLIHDATYQQ